MAPPGLTELFACEAIIGYGFQDQLLLWEALQADGSPICSTDAPRYQEGNKRLAVLGEAALNLLLASKWYPTMEDTADFDNKRNRITSDLRLNSVGCCQELHRFVTTAADHQAKDDAEVTNDTIKAIIGATYLDGGMDAAQKVVRSLGYNMY